MSGLRLVAETTAKQEPIVAMRIVSGGQTGVDRAALDAALALGLDYTGWCPQGGWAEDMPTLPGLLAAYPKLRPTESADPAVRTRLNVADSDATLILLPDAELARSPGTALAASVAQDLGRPLLIAVLGAETQPITAWIAQLGEPLSLNIAGPRESEVPGIQAQAYAMLLSALGPLADSLSHRS